ncbi:exodeoxyribonuclease III [Oceanispirochaeta sp.]|jgi:exodeoxyribonuclease-3|uniref:exodeoxyribonuclease III n=1 Tax=Oceanispirochaeta sp. TaxID=2035350 RepID=UPI00261DA71D|nr:exodeoxyribonuclease III [Oceanispirochaeta sp.]MDA3958492.1 exodeoxyribonuclease III [Oceanispirochaeta sp.]
MTKIVSWNVNGIRAVEGKGLFKWMDEFTENGYTDTFRVFHKEPEQYSWWSYRMKARDRNVGWRLDYFCVNDDFLDQVEDSLIHQEILGSDHCPVELIIK